MAVLVGPNKVFLIGNYSSFTLSAHAREGYNSHFVCLSVCLCVTLILEKAPKG